MSDSAGRLTATQGTAMYIGAVLGTGAITLPALAVKVAGPGSLLTWLGLAILSAPLAVTFAALGARYPDAGGVATYARLAFGDWAGTAVGWCFYFTIPLGGPAAGLWAGAYISAATHTGALTTDGTALMFLLIVPLGNVFGVRLTGKVQLAFAGLLMVFLLTAVGFSLPSARLGNLRPFAPHGWLAVGRAGDLLIWCFVGWEAVTYLTAEFRRPARDVPKATAAAVIVVGLMYLAVAFATVAVLGQAAGATNAPLAGLMAAGLGANGRLLAAATAVLVTFGALNAYYAGASKLGAALGRDGGFPAWVGRGSLAGEVPRRSLAIVSALSLAAWAVDVAVGVGPEPLVLLTSGLFVAVYAFGIAAGIRLLPRRTKAWACAVAALVVVAILFVVSGVYLIWPALVTGGALFYLRRPGRSGRRAEA